MISVEIDRGSGFCGGVIRAINGAEKALAEGGTILSLGDIVHNEAELSRLRSLGLSSIGIGDLQLCKSGENQVPHRVAAKSTLLIRAHGEPPSTYALAESLGFKVLDYTCPVVLRIQRSIREAYARLHSSQPYGQIVIFGKIGHAEVLGLVGQVDGNAIVVENLQQLQDLVNEGRLNTARRIEIFSQTTKSPIEYSEICAVLSEKAQAGLTVHNTICSQVASRHEELSSFAQSHDIIIFVSGASSSNGKVLCDLCRSRNPRTYHISSPDDIDPAWFGPDDRVGICGATSTPRWLLEQVAEAVR